MYDLYICMSLWFNVDPLFCFFWSFTEKFNITKNLQRVQSGKLILIIGTVFPISFDC